MHVLATDVDRVVVVRRNSDGKGPVPAILHVLGAHAVAGLRPDFDRTRLACTVVVSFEARVVAAAPDDVRVHRVRDGKARFAAADGGPQPDRAAVLARVRWTLVRVAVLSVSVDVVGDAIVDERMIHLRVRQYDARPALSPIDGDADAAVVTDHHPVGVVGIDPHVVEIATGARWSGCFR